MKTHPKILRLKKFTMGLFLSLASFLNKMLANTGTNVSVNNRAPNNAKLNVHASGENILPSTFSKAKIQVKRKHTKTGWVLSINRR